MAEGPEIKNKVKFESKGLDKVKADVAGLGQEIATVLAALTAGGSKVMNLWRAMGGILTGRVLGPLGLISGAIFGILGAMKLVVQQSQLLARGMQTVAKLEFLEKQFLPLVKGAALAKERIKELFVFAATTPFQLPGIVEASRVLQVLTRGSLSTGNALTMIGDAAAIAGQPLEAVAMWVGRLYDSLRSGAPIGEAVSRLQEMGLISGQARRELEGLTTSGAEFSVTWALVERELRKAEGGMKQLSETMGGLQTTLADVRAAFAGAFAEPFLGAEKDSIRNSIALFQAFTPVIAHLGSVIAAAQAPFRKLTSLVLQSGPAMQALSSTAIAATNAFLLFAAAVGATQLKVAIIAVHSFTRALIAKAAATKLSAAATLEATVAENLNALATGRGTAAKVAATVATRAFAGSMALLRGALSLVTTTAKAAWVALAANPLLALGSAVVAAIGLSILRLQQQAKAVKDLNQANQEARAVVMDQIRNMRTEADRAETLTAAYMRLAEARRKLTELRESGGSVNEIAAQQAAVKQAEADANRVKATGGLSPAEKSLEARRAELDLAERIRDIVMQGELSRMNAAEQALAIAKEQESIAQRIAAAEDKKAARESGAQALAGLRAQQDALKAELAENQARQATDLRVGGDDVELTAGPGGIIGAQKLDKAALAARNREIIQESKALAAEIARIESAGSAGLTTQRDIENLDELKTKQAQLVEQQADISQRRDEAIDKAEELIAVQSKLNQASQATLDGDLERAAILRDEARELQKQADIKERINQLTRQGVGQAEAERRAQEQAMLNDERRELGQQRFLRARMLEIQADEAANLGTPEGDAEAQRLRDSMRLDELTDEFINRGGLDPEQAQEAALRQLGAEIGSPQSKGPQVVADSSRSVGLGGRAFGGDAILDVNRQSRDYLKTLVALAQKNQSTELTLK